MWNGIIATNRSKGVMRQGNNSRRSRGRGNGKRQSRGNQIDSHGPEVRVRGTAQQVCDKYLALARDATSSGDRIGAENMFQHAEHYSRVLAMAQENAEQRNDNRDGGKSRHERGGNGQNNDPSQDPNEFESNENTQMTESLNGTPEPDDKAKGLEKSDSAESGSPVSNNKNLNADDNSPNTKPAPDGEGKEVTL